MKCEGGERVARRPHGCCAASGDARAHVASSLRCHDGGRGERRARSSRRRELSRPSRDATVFAACASGGMGARAEKIRTVSARSTGCVRLDAPSCESQELATPTTRRTRERTRERAPLAHARSARPQTLATDGPKCAKRGCSRKRGDAGQGASRPRGVMRSRSIASLGASCSQRDGHRPIEGALLRGKARHARNSIDCAANQVAGAMFAALSLDPIAARWFRSIRRKFFAGEGEARASQARLTLDLAVAESLLGNVDGAGGTCGAGWRRARRVSHTSARDGLAATTYPRVAQRRAPHSASSCGARRTIPQVLPNARGRRFERSRRDGSRARERICELGTARRRKTSVRTCTGPDSPGLRKSFRFTPRGARVGKRNR
jgi:hypothetical protein